MNNFESIRAYGSKIDTLADSFLAKQPSDLYGMLRYFMGYVDEQFVSVQNVSGKRLRPALLLFIAEEYGVLERALPAALSIELFHNFSLIHDDIEDNDEFRRGRPTVWKLWGINKALNAGDVQLLLAIEALHTCSTEDRDAYHRLEPFLLRQYREVAEGQHLDFSLAEGRIDEALVTEERYRSMITKKSAALIGASAASAGHIAGLPAERVDALYEFGKELGIAYQLYDDRQSLWGSTLETGKTVAGDIQERKKTLPVIFARDHLPKEQREELVALYGNPKTEIVPILKLIEQSGAQKYLEDAIRLHRQCALEALRRTNLSEERSAMLEEFTNTLIP